MKKRDRFFQTIIVLWVIVVIILIPFTENIVATILCLGVLPIALLIPIWMLVSNVGNIGRSLVPSHDTGREVKKGLSYLLPKRETLEQVVALVIMAGVIVGIGLGAWWLYRTLREEVVRGQYGDQAVDLCEQVTDDPDALDRAFQTLPADVHLVFLEMGSSIKVMGAYQDALPSANRADGEEDLDVVVCVQAEKIDIGSASYGVERASGDTVTYTCNRYQEEHTFYVIDVGDGKLIESFTVTGSLPEACPNETDRSLTYTGDPPPTDDVIARVLRR